MALAASARSMTHSASYSGKGSSADPLFGNGVCAPCLTQGDLLPPITCKDRVRLQGAILVFTESKRGQETTMKGFSRGAPAVGGGNHNLLQA